MNIARKKGITQKQMAEKSGDNYPHREKYGPLKHKFLEKVAEALEIDISLLIYGERSNLKYI